MPMLCWLGSRPVGGGKGAAAEHIGRLSLVALGVSLSPRLCNPVHTTAQNYSIPPSATNAIASTTNVVTPHVAE